jgi:hypothetical protein
MGRYRLHEGEIRIPDEWKDLSINSFVLPGQKGSSGEASLVISRDADTPARDVQNYVDLQTVEAAKRLKGYKLVDRQSFTLNGQPAAGCTYTWTTPERVTVQQGQVCVRRGKVFLTLTMTAKATDFDKYEQAWTTAVQSLTLRQD